MTCHHLVRVALVALALGAGDASAGTLPAPPSWLIATAPSSSTINLNWAAVRRNVDGNVIERSLADSGPFARIATVGARETSYADEGLAAGTTYYYRVRSTRRRNVSEPSNVAAATTLGSAKRLLPSAPTGLVASAASCSEVDLGWSAPADRGIGVHGYNVYRDGNWAQYVTAPATRASDSGMRPGARDRKSVV